MKCKKCSVELTNDNWNSSQRKLNICRCKLCHRKQQHLYYSLNKEKHNLYKRNYYKTTKGKEVCKNKSKKYTLSFLGKESMKRGVYRRKRELGFIPLNEWFEGCEAHHLDEEYVVYIPKELHRAHPHNHKKRETMIEINTEALEWIRLQIV